ncbi:GNAT family protein [Phocaeicola dorei]|uniref:N-acetyltransferase n=3 Tax=Bacteroidales TaxID=171549 RepID=A0A415HE60_9BACE|nr:MULTISPECIES: GNAT family protein [Bacteroidales]RGZ99675.1 N-acetyltransferase [Phocaeicola vulgatus]MDV7064082.1 GNAT family protein [Phocaeicola dorei]RHB83887.1 N-acetyltransferase [Parabacteroides distasonis]RHK89738.1 N-acetyltransferase [Bacteroides xylanisolvens]RJU13092.1 N-acetyltransferase [Bacteroides sp. AF39-16AC]
MERSGNFYKAIRLGYILISILIGCMAYNSLYEWQEIEALELGNKKIDELRKEINNINIQMIKFSLLGETILEWNDKDIEHYHARRIYGFVEDDNIRSKRLCERLGMRREGCFKEFVTFINNPNGTPKYEDTRVYSILKKEWNSISAKSITNN